MAKLPVAGRVKTRLANELGVAAAVRFARHTIANTASRLANQRRWETTIAVSPSTDAKLPLPRGVLISAQARGDLGQRMQRIMDTAPPGPVVIIGTDIPGIASSHIAQAFHLLGRHDFVFGPALDGGYWLVGAKRRPRLHRAFANVRWSTPHALEDTVRNLRHCSIGYVPTLSDVDTAEDLADPGAAIGRRVRPMR